LPIYSVGQKQYSTEEVIKAVFTASNEGKVCTTQPYGCEQNMSFVVDLSELDDRNDIRSDDLGAWRNVGVHNVFASVSFNNDDSVKRVTILGSQPPNVTRSTIYKVKKTYWRHKVASDFSRKLFEILGMLKVYYTTKAVLCSFF
jgi:hypothetical protein